MFGRLDYQLSGSQRLMGRVNYTQYDGRPRDLVVAEPDEQPQRPRGPAVARLRRLLEQPVGRERS